MTDEPTLQSCKISLPIKSNGPTRYEGGRGKREKFHNPDRQESPEMKCWRFCGGSNKHIVNENDDRPTFPIRLTELCHLLHRHKKKLVIFTFLPEIGTQIKSNLRAKKRKREDCLLGEINYQKLPPLTYFLLAELCNGWRVNFEFLSFD